jgi:DNA-binding XRE family transcriptional regulator
VPVVQAELKILKKRNMLISQERPSRSDLPQSWHSEEVEAALRRERMVFAAKVRGARAILGWSQRELGRRVALTQKSVYKMEQGIHGLRRSTVATVEHVLKAEGIEFEDLPDGGFKVVVPEPVLAKHERASVES